jgi:hypothetical protein
MEAEVLPLKFGRPGERSERRWRPECLDRVRPPFVSASARMGILSAGMGKSQCSGELL